MDNDEQGIVVTAPIHQTQFLAFNDDAEFGPLSEADRLLLAAVVCYDAERRLPGDTGDDVWFTPPPVPAAPVETSSSVDIEFGGASEVFNSLNSGTFETYRSDHDNPSAGPGDYQQEADSLASKMNGVPPGYVPVVPQPGGGPQHIHINHYTANLTYHATRGSNSNSNPGSRPESLGPTPIPRQPIPFTANFPLNYVAPFPHSSPTPPLFSAPFHPMMMYPPGPGLHFSMYAPAPNQHSYPPPPVMQPMRDQKLEPPGNLMYGFTPVVSMKHSGSDEELEDHRPVDKYRGEELPSELEQPRDDQVADHEADFVIDSVDFQDVRSHPEVVDQHITSSNDQEVETLCGEIDSVSIPDVPQTNLIEKRASLSREGGMKAPAHLPTPPPFPIINSERSDSLNSQVSGHESEQEGRVETKSWASLFTNSFPSADRIPVDRPMARIPPFSNDQAQGVSHGDLNHVNAEDSKLMGEYLKMYELRNVAPSFLPRGLTNRSNWCFVNAVLQALLSCPPFFNLIKDLGNKIGERMGCTSTPMMDCMVRLTKEFEPLEAMNKSQTRDKTRRREDLPVGNAFEPNYVYQTLLEAAEQSFKVVEGRQEDAEEFLGHLLNKLDEEMRTLIQLSERDQGSETQAQDVDEGDWSEMNARGRSCVTRRTGDRAQAARTPIQLIASGLVRNSIRISTSEASANLQPFFALQLDIQANSVHSVEDALRENFASEMIEGYSCPVTKQETEATRKSNLEELPTILILHLKRMVYDGQTGLCRKVMKEISCPVDLEISRDILSVNSKTRYTLKQRQYKLFAVVYHKGMEATKGHYVADVYHNGYVSWLRCDDSTVKATPEQTVGTGGPGSTPYILFYRRCDTLVGVHKYK